MSATCDDAPRAGRGIGECAVTSHTALLLVEGEAALRQLLADILGGVGLDALEVDTAATAISVSRERSVDLALVYSADRDQISTLALFVPVVAIVDSGWHWTAEELGARCIVPLVFRIEELEGAVRACLRPATHLSATFPQTEDG